MNLVRRPRDVIKQWPETQRRWWEKNAGQLHDMWEYSPLYYNDLFELGSRADVSFENASRSERRENAVSQARILTTLLDRRLGIRFEG